MAELVSHTVAPGTIAGLAQPTFPLADGVEVRPWTDGDAAAVLAAYVDPDIQRWHVRGIDSHDEARELIAAWRRAWSQEQRLEWAVAGTDGTVLGRLALKNLVLFDGIAEVAYWTVPAERGRGLAAQAVTRPRASPRRRPSRSSASRPYSFHSRGARTPPFSVRPPWSAPAAPSRAAVARQRT